MILFLSTSFLRRLALEWKPALKALLIGHRNLFFFTPDTLKEVSEITPEMLDSFLQRSGSEDGWDLLGFLSPDQRISVPGLAQILTDSNRDPSHWKASVCLLEDGKLKEKGLEIRLAGKG